jgi:plasmid stabilization system protein ParE
MVDRTRQVAWTRAALECLDEILATIAAEAPAAAERVLGVFDSTAESLSDLATRGRVVPEIAESAIREVFVYRYRLIYQVGLDDVRILAVIPGAMDYRAWLQRS